MITITKRIELDAGHRIPHHESKCRNLHGHRYVVEVELAGQLAGYGSETGMVADFGWVKEWLTANVHDRWDHAFLVWRDDKTVLNFLHENDFAYWVMVDVPTAENLAFDVGSRLSAYLLGGARGQKVVRATVWETPTCHATWRPPPSTAEVPT